MILVNSRVIRTMHGALNIAWSLLQLCPLSANKLSLQKLEKHARPRHGLGLRLRLGLGLSIHLGKNGTLQF